MPSAHVFKGVAATSNYEENTLYMLIVYTCKYPVFFVSTSSAGSYIQRKRKGTPWVQNRCWLCMTHVKFRVFTFYHKIIKIFHMELTLVDLLWQILSNDYITKSCQMLR